MAGKKKITQRKTAATAAAKATRVKTARPLSIQQWMERIIELHSDPRASAGACLVTFPDTGTPYCIQTSPDACKAMKGIYIGGPCAARP